jgi:hypothetical protein
MCRLGGFKSDPEKSKNLARKGLALCPKRSVTESAGAQPAPGSPPPDKSVWAGRGSAANDVANLREIPVSTLKRNGTTATKFDLVTFNLNDRRNFIGGSDSRIILGNDEANLIRLWREKRGEVEPEDLSDNLIVQLGRVTEELNRRWYERNTGHAIKDMQRRIRHPVNKWMAATLDGLVDPGGAVFEAKFMLPWTFSEQVAAEKHMAQLQHNMWVANAPNRRCCLLSPAVESGSKLPFMPIRFTNICCLPRRRNSGAASKAAKNLGCSGSNRHGRGWRRCGLSI